MKTLYKDGKHGMLLSSKRLTETWEGHRWRFVRLDWLRRALTVGDGAVYVHRSPYAKRHNWDDTGRVSVSVSIKFGFLRIGCRYFKPALTAQILKAARVTLQQVHHDRRDA